MEKTTPAQEKNPNQLQQLIAKLVRPEIQAMSAYHVPDASGMLKLDAMESPFSWPGELMAEWQQKLREADVNRYPDPQATKLKRKIRQVMGVDPAYEILLGNGSDEIIQLIIQALACDGAIVMSPAPSFVMFKVIAEINRVAYVGVDLGENFQLDESAMIAAIATYRPAVIFLAQPNNPTGNIYDLQSVKRIIEATPGLVVIDEAYTAFTDSDHLSLLDNHENVVIMRTASKVGLAGLRLGMLFGRPEWLSEFDKVRLPYNINILTQLSGEFAFEHYEQLAQLAEQIKQQRDWLIGELAKFSTLRVWPSQANFIVVKSLTRDAKKLHESLKENGVLVKCLAGGHPLLENCLRITVSHSQENQQFLQVLKTLV